ncbi:MAG: hypothetical protein ACPG6B_04505 [Oceanihabitans sp.]
MHKDLNNIQNSGFTTPKDYFKNFKVNTLVHSNKTQNNKESGFVVPQDYFKNFKSNALPKKHTKVVRLSTKNKLLFISSIAATIVILLNIFLFNTKTGFESLEFQTVENYIINHAETNEITDLFATNELNETNFIQYNLNEETLNYYLDSLEETDLILD